jgi:hypothetical protein
MRKRGDGCGKVCGRIAPLVKETEEATEVRPNCARGGGPFVVNVGQYKIGHILRCEFGEVDRLFVIVFL